VSVEDKDKDKPAAFSKTLDRGLQALQIVVDANRPISAQEVADALGLHRSIVYRVLRTLEEHRLVQREDAGHFIPGVGLAVLARSVRRTLQDAALPVLSTLANELGATAFVVVPDEGHAVTIATVEPRQTQVHLARRPGARHPIDHGAPGIAILAARPRQPGERAAVRQARERGWAHSFGEVIHGLHSLAAPIVDAEGEVLGSVAVVYVDPSLDAAPAGARLIRAAAQIVEGLA
jgi:DNA-binding IclR family transcriptional regulator